MDKKALESVNLEQVEPAIDAVIEKWRALGGQPTVQDGNVGGIPVKVWVNPPRVLLQVMTGAWAKDERAEHVMARLVSKTHAEFQELVDNMEWGIGDAIAVQIVQAIKARRDTFLPQPNAN